jgi:hypothetical protein
VGMQLDLCRDFAEVSTYVSDRVRAFEQASNRGPGKAGPVKRVDVGYESDQSGWVAVVFDTRPDAEPDGQWTLYIQGNELERPHWLEANEGRQRDIQDMWPANFLQQSSHANGYCRASSLLPA